jgi:ANTAR domain
MPARHAARDPGAHRRHGGEGTLAAVRVEGGLARDRLLPGAAADRRREPAGALNLYGRAAGAFGARETRRAERFAQNAAGALALALRLSSYAALTDQLRASLASRTVIDQAIGVIMAQERCGQARAFSLLRAASQNRNVKLSEIAAAIVTSVSGEPPQPPAFEVG